MKIEFKRLKITRMEKADNLKIVKKGLKFRLKSLNLFGFLVLFILSGTVTSCLDLLDNSTIPTKEEELSLLNEYLTSLQSKGYNIDTTSQGLYYVVMDKGEGAFANTGDTLTVGYAGYYVNGALFGTTMNEAGTEDLKWTFILGKPEMIKGWDQGMKLMKKNSRVQLIAPSDLAYGSVGNGTIGPYKTLVFVVKMYDIKPSKH